VGHRDYDVNAMEGGKDYNDKKVLNEQIQWVSVVGCPQGFNKRVRMAPRCEAPTGNLFSSYPLLVYSGIYDFAFLLILLTGKTTSLTQLRHCLRPCCYTSLTYAYADRVVVMKC